jgi:hypothetical protein
VNVILSLVCHRVKGIQMKHARLFFLLAILTVPMLRADIRVTAVQGRVYVRHNVQEQWVALARGDVLKPDDSMKSDLKSSATILIDGKTAVVVPELAIVDISDLRTLTREELVLKLAMERVRRVPGRGNPDELTVPGTTTTHGANRGEQRNAPDPDPRVGSMQMKGAEVLFGNGFYETGVLKAKGLFRLHPELSGRIEDRLMVAKALETLNLKGEALEEYLEVGKEQLTDAQQELVTRKIEQLRGAR